MEARHCVDYCRAFVFGIFFALMSLVGILWRIVRHPINSITTIRPKRRDVMPACLNDPAYGTHKFIHLEEVRLHYVACGDESKPLMLFLHGFPEFWYSWRYQIKEFKKDYRVVAVDMRGYGDSDKPKGVASYKMETLIGDIKQLIPALGYRSCILVAHDWGGLIAWQFAAKHQDLVDKLIVMNAPHSGTFKAYLRTHKEQAKKSWYVAMFQVPFVPELIISVFDYEMIKGMLCSSRTGTRVTKLTEEDKEAYVYSMSRPGGLTNPINYYRAGLRYQLGKWVYNQMEKPALMIWGCQDAALEKDLAALPSKYVPNLTVKYIEEASHWVQMDTPEKVNSIMREWLKE